MAMHWGKIMFSRIGIGVLGLSVAMMSGCEPVKSMDKGQTFRSTIQAASWNPLLASIPDSGRQLHTATVLASGKILVVGGLDGNTILADSQVYNPTNDTWCSPSTAPVGTAGLTTGRYAHTATLLPSSGKVLVAGGITDTGPTASAEIYDPTDGTCGGWTPIADMYEPRAVFTATYLPASSKVLMVGGLSYGYGAVDSFEFYDPNATDPNDPWIWGTTLGSSGEFLASPRAYHTATLLPSGKVLVTGGYTGTLQNSAEVYDPSVVPSSITHYWTATCPMALERYWHTATMLENGKVLVAGGYNNPNSVLTATNTAELYDPTVSCSSPTTPWSSAGTMNSSRAAHTATKLVETAPEVSNKVLITGGEYASSPSYSYRASAEIYDESTNSWTSTSSMDTARAYHTASLTSAGKVLIMGGTQDASGSTGLDAVEEYTR
jgi:N-acetylneuraminic acid mutarotase